MALSQRRGLRALVQLTAVMLVGAGLSACSTVPDWVDPTTWMGPDTSAQAETGDYPDLAAIPDRPETPSSSESQAAVADSLAAARSHVQYSAEALRGGGEPAAAPPEAAPPPQAAPSDTDTAPAPQASDESAPPAEASAEPAEAPDPAAAEAAPPAPAPAAEQAAAAPAPMAPPAAASVAAAQPATPAGRSVTFEPSRAPPLDASVAQFVPAPIIQRYAETGAIASPQAAPAGDSVKLKAPPGTRATALGTSRDNVGGPEGMSGAVVADLGAVGDQSRPTSVYAGPDGLAPVAVVLFTGNSSALSAAGREQVQAAVAAYRARGSQGYVRVVGHSSGRTGAMSMVRHMELNFETSQARAKSVARELIREGVPADKVLVDAVGDAQPIYRESMPSGEDGNRRAEIFLQG